MTTTEPEPTPIGYGTTREHPFTLHKVASVPLFGHVPGCASIEHIAAFWSRLSDTGETLQRCTDCFGETRTALD